MKNTITITPSGTITLSPEVCSILDIQKGEMIDVIESEPKALYVYRLGIVKRGGMRVVGDRIIMRNKTLYDTIVTSEGTKILDKDGNINFKINMPPEYWDYIKYYKLRQQS